MSLLEARKWNILLQTGSGIDSFYACLKTIVHAISINEVENLEWTPAQTPAVLSEDFRILCRKLGRNRFFANLTVSFCSATDQIVRTKWAEKPSSCTRTLINKDEIPEYLLGKRLHY